MGKAIAIIFILSSTIFAADINEVCRKGLQVYESNEKLKDESDKATEELNSRRNSLYSSQRTLKKGFSPDQISELKKDMASLQKNIANYERYLKEYKAKLKAKEELMAISKLSKEEQNKKKAEIDKELDEVSKKVAALNKPFRDKRYANEKSIASEEKEFDAFMKQQFKTSKTLKIDSVDVNPGLASAFSSISWKRGNERVLWAHVRMRPIPEENKGKRIFDKYTATTISDNSIWYWAGHFQIAFVASSQDFKNKDKLKEAIKELINSEGLAAVKAK